MKSEIFAQIIEKVAEVTELTTEQILSKTKTDDLVAARSLFVHFCVMRGLPSVSIAQFMMRKKTNSINRYLASYDVFFRSSLYFREMVCRIESLL